MDSLSWRESPSLAGIGRSRRTQLDWEVGQHHCIGRPVAAAVAQAGRHYCIYVQLQERWSTAIDPYLRLARLSSGRSMSRGGVRGLDYGWCPNKAAQAYESRLRRRFEL